MNAAADDAGALVVRPIGRLITPFATTSDCPRNGRLLDPPPVCRAVVLPEFVEGLQDLEGFSHLILLYWLNQASPPVMRLKPRSAKALHGVFATRTPRRPNPIGMSVVAFDGFDGPDTLKLRYLDCVNGTPLIDIKPYIARTDAEPKASLGWLQDVPLPPLATKR